MFDDYVSDVLPDQFNSDVSREPHQQIWNKSIPLPETELRLEVIVPHILSNHRSLDIFYELRRRFNGAFHTIYL